MDFSITPLLAADWPAVRAIYLEGLATGLASFETHAPEWSTWDAAHLPFARLAARQGELLRGWAALSPVSARLAYHGVAEISLYVAAAARRQGVGRALLHLLVEASEAQGIWMLQAVLCAENEASLALHMAGGFRLVGRRERIAQRDGRWHDTLLLERRSPTVGV